MCDTGAFDGMALSPGILEGLNRTQGLRVVQCRWRYGDASLRSRPFPPHRSLAGKFTTMAGQAGSGFDGFSGYSPGDHKGCLCSLVPVFARPPTSVV